MPGLYKYRFTAKQIAEIETAYKEATDPEISRRLEMLLLRTQNVPTKKIKEITGYDRDTVAQQVNKYRKNGLKAVIGGWPVNKKYEYKYKFTPKQIKEIRSAHETTDDKRIALRLKALLLRAQGIPFEEIGKQTGYTRSGLDKMLRLYQNDGLAAIASKRIFPYKHSFTEDQIAEIERARKTPSSQWVERRLEVLWLRASGIRDIEITAATGYSGTSIRRLVRTYNEHGISAILGKNVLK